MVPPAAVRRLAGGAAAAVVLLAAGARAGERTHKVRMHVCHLMVDDLIDLIGHHTLVVCVWGGGERPGGWVDRPPRSIQMEPRMMDNWVDRINQ